MRFVFSICVIIAFIALEFLLLGLSFSQTLDLSDATQRSFTPRLQKGKQTERLTPAEGLILEIVETGLGNISALTRNQNGFIYTSDPDTGRIWSLYDRNKDGRVDVKRALPYRFDRPTGLAAINDTLYIADRAAIWVVEKQNSPRKLAGLKNANSTAAYHPLALTEDGNMLFLGLTSKDNITSILTIDLKTGKAELQEERNETEQIRHISALSNNSPWVLTERRLGSNLSRATVMHNDYKILSMALPLDAKNWPSDISQSVIISQQSAQGFSVMALPAALGRVETKGKIILSGFLSETGRTAWGSPGPLLFDDHGLLVADSFNGDIYRLRAPLKPTPTAPVVNTKDNTNEEEVQPSKTLPSMVVSTITGSQIESASSLDSATTLETGSTILRDYKPLEVEKSDPETSRAAQPPN